jgi:hypothetical protein
MFFASLTALAIRELIKRLEQTRAHLCCCRRNCLYTFGDRAGFLLLINIGSFKGPA